MKNETRSILVILQITIVNFAANFLIFTYSYNRLATPHLTEEQRVSNADFIMTGTLGMFAATAALTGILVFFKYKKRI